MSFKRRVVPSPSPLSLLTGRVMDLGDMVVRSLSIHGHGRATSREDWVLNKSSCQITHPHLYMRNFHFV